MNKFVLLFVIALCGTCSSSTLNRIANGTPASVYNQFPYMISVQQKSLASALTRGHRCGGALVSLRHAVTSAACLHNNLNGVHTLLNPSEYRVFAGGINLNNDTSADLIRDIERFTVHPNYAPGNPFVNDIAVITFTSEFSTNNVQIVPLASTDVREPCISSGWGSQNDTNVPSIQLMYLQKYAMTDNNQCQSFYEGNANLVPQVTLQSSMICGLSIASDSSCQGDLGNPLVCNGNLQGILISPAFSNCSAPILYPRAELYTRVSSFRPWITTTAGASTFQPTMAVLAVITIFQFITTKVLN